jgi:hypothetical protein
MSEPYLSANQSRDRAPTVYENLLGDGLERAFAAGVTEPAGIVEALNAEGVPTPNGGAWSVELLCRELKRLGA